MNCKKNKNEFKCQNRRNNQKYIYTKGETMYNLDENN